MKKEKNDKARKRIRTEKNPQDNIGTLGGNVANPQGGFVIQLGNKKNREDRFGKQVGKWWKKSREIWDKSAKGNYAPGDMAADLAQLAVHGMESWRSLFGGGEAGIPYAYKEVSRADLENQDLKMEIDFYEELPKEVKLVDDSVRLVAEFPVMNGPTISALPFKLEQLAEAIRIIIPKYANATTKVKTGMYEGLIRSESGGTPTGILHGIIKLRLNS